MDSNITDVHKLCCIQLTGAVRLVGGSNSSEGRVEILSIEDHGAVWRKVPSKNWDPLDARVVCRFLEYADVSKTFTDSSKHPFGRGMAESYLLELACDGTEESLAECSTYPQDPILFYYGDPAVICNNTTIPNQG